MLMQKYEENQFRNRIVLYSFWLAFFVVGIHAYNVDVYGLIYKEDLFSKVVMYLEYFVKNISGVCVPFFFIISGYLFFRTYNWSKVFTKYKSRVKSVLIPFIIWCSIYYVYYCILSRLPGIGNYINDGNQIELSIETWINWLWKDSYYTLWFLKELIILIILSPVFYLLMKNYKYCPVGAIVLFCFVLNTMGIIEVTVPNGFSNIYYLFGVYIGINYKEAPMVKSRLLALMGSVGTVIIVLFFCWARYYTIDINPLIYILLCITLWLASANMNFGKEVKWWMHLSFFIYCIHDILLEGIEKIFFIIFGNESIYALLDYLFMPALVVALSVCIAAFCKRWIPFLWTLLTGNRGEV